MKQQNHLPLRMMLLPLARMVSLLSAAEILSDSTIVPDGELEKKLRRDNVSQSKVFYLNKMRIAFMFRLFSETKEFATKYSHFNAGTLMMLYHQSISYFWEGLVSYWIGRAEDNTEWLLKGHSATQAIQKLVDCSEWNFQNKLFLLKAEQQFCARDFILAENYYDAAISSSREHRFLNEEALSLELAAFFYLETGRRSRSIDFFSRAISKYREWEAHAKAQSLEAHLEKVKNNQHTM
jgi:tetratricopeptide (TPR) repeat protein